MYELFYLVIFKIVVSSKNKHEEFEYEFITIEITLTVLS